MALGWDGTGDIFQWDERYSDKLKADSGGAFHLVTGDGGIDCTVSLNSFISLQH
jgi:hypothetical protein